MYFKIPPSIQHFIKSIIFISILMLAGCTDEIEKLKLSEEHRAHVLKLQNPFGEDYVRFSVAGEEYPAMVGASACNLYRAKVERGVVTEWIKIPKLSRFYPTGSSCTSQSIKFDGKYVMYSYCAIAIGAGGGCAGGYGTYRSVDGKEWEESLKDKWKSIDGDK